MSVEQIPLPGIGTRYTMRTTRDRHIGTIRHRDGRRSLLVFDPEDHDRATTIELSRREANTLALLLHDVDELLAAPPEVPVGGAGP